MCRENQLHYEILISGKAFPLNGTIPIAFKFTPLAKVRLHRIKILLSENVEYHCRDKKYHRMEPMRTLLLFEKQAQKSGEVSRACTFDREASFISSSESSGAAISGSRSPPPTSDSRPSPPVSSRGLPRVIRPAVGRKPTRDDQFAHSLLGNLEGGDGSGTSTEFEVNVPLPGCRKVRTPVDNRKKNSPLVPVQFHHTTIWPNIVVHHWIKIVLRVSKGDENPENKGKRRHFEISIDSPIQLLSVPSLCAGVGVDCSVVLKRIPIFPRIAIRLQSLSRVQM